MKQHAQRKAQESAASGGSGNWFKPAVGPSKVRICPPWSPVLGLPFREIVHHQLKDKEGKLCMPVAFDYVFNDPYVFKYLVRANKVDKADYRQWKRHGDPMTELGKIVKNNTDKETYQALPRLFPQTRYLWNLVFRGDRQLYIYGSSSTFYKTVISLWEYNPNMLHPRDGQDLIISATGEGKARRYGAPMLVPQSSPAKIPRKLFDLDEAMSIGYRGYIEVLQLMHLHLRDVIKQHAPGFSLKKFLE